MPESNLGGEGAIRPKTEQGRFNWKSFTEQVSQLGFKISPAQLQKFQSYYELLLEWNRKINLVSRQDTDRLVSYHFVDSLLVLSASGGLPPGGIIYDLGSGAGLPGIPLKIMRDDIVLYLIESIQKKAAFLSLVVEKLALKNVNIIPERAENITEIKCDVVLIRLVGKIKKVVPVAVSLLKPAGKIIFYKSATAAEEIREAKKIFIKFRLQPTIKELTLPGTEIIRRLVILEKVNNTLSG